MGCGSSKENGNAANHNNGNVSNMMQQVVQGTAETLQTIGQRTFGQANHHVRNVFAKPLDAAVFALGGGSAAQTYKPPVFPKPDEEAAFLKAALPKNFCFERSSESELQLLVDAMERVTVPVSHVIIQQGSETTNSTSTTTSSSTNDKHDDYFYVIYSGTVQYSVDGVNVGTGTAGDSFGELSLLYSSPRAATVTAVSTDATTDATTDASSAEVVLYRVDQTAFRYILQQQRVSAGQERIAVLKQVSFLTSNLDDYSLHKLAAVMKETSFAVGTVIFRRGDAINDDSLFYVLSRGAVKATDVMAGSAHYQDMLLDKPGEYFGERALITGEPRAANATVVGDTDAVFYTIDKKSFEEALGDFKTAMSKAGDTRILSAIPIIAETGLNAQSLTALAELISDRTWTSGTVICQAGVSTDHAALYLVRTGSVTIVDKAASGGSSAETTRTVGPGGYFGDDQLLVDVNKDDSKKTTTKKDYTIGAATVPFVPSYTVIAAAEDVTCGVLTVASCRKVIDTRRMGQKELDSIFLTGVPLASLKRHAILGAGTFGMVFLVSRENAIGERVAYALKVQSKYELYKEGLAQSVVYEKNIMAKLHHPFLIGLVQTYQDRDFVYLLLQLVQGGELYSYMHTPKHDFLPDSDAKFYAACVADGLGDLKPENVMVDATGYCVIIDFGFAKYVPAPTFTFTLCGTPLYLPPEVILNRGHNGSADHWSLGILIHEMLTGTTPFYKTGMGQIELFKAIVKNRFQLPAQFMSKDEVTPAGSIITELLTKDPAKRLGNLAGGEDGLVQHPWFSSNSGGINFDELRQKRVKAPQVPTIKNPLDSSNFEDWSHLQDKSKIKFPKLSPQQMKVFDDF